MPGSPFFLVGSKVMHIIIAWKEGEPGNESVFTPPNPHHVSMTNVHRR